MAQDSRQALSNEMQTMKQTSEKTLTTIGQRLAEAENTNANLQTDLSAVEHRLHITQGELKKAREDAQQIRDEEIQHLSVMDAEMRDQLALKATNDDVRLVNGQVDVVRTDLDGTKKDLQMARSEMGTLIAKNHDEVEELRRLGERDYYEFTIDKKDQRQKVGDLMIELRGVNPKKNVYTIAMYIDDARYEKKNRSVNEPIYFFSRGTRAPMELTVNQVGKDKIAGYLSVPKSASNTHAQASGN